MVRSGFRFPFATIGAVILFLTSCSDSPTGRSLSPASQFQLSVCSLGCTGGGTCAVNEIATNQDISLRFNDLVDPSSVHPGTISLVERGSGGSPAGSFLVQGDQVIFRPALVQGENGLSFGFKEGKEYHLKLFAQPESSAVRSRGGRVNRSHLSCIVRAAGVLDPVPGAPVVSMSPNWQQPPGKREFDIQLAFNDIIDQAQLVDAFGGSPSIQVHLVDETQSVPIRIEVDGVFSAELDQEKLVTTVRFQALGAYPGNAEAAGKARRWLEVTVAGYISDLANHSLTNPGVKQIPLPRSVPVSSAFAEEFVDQAQVDPGGSTAGLWNSSTAAGLDSGLDPQADSHRGGGPGVLGVFAPTTDFEFNTNSMTFEREDTLINRRVTVQGGAFFFEEVVIPRGVTIRAKGDNPLRIYSRGQLVVNGSLDLSGEDADASVSSSYPSVPAHDGKYVPYGELESPEPQPALFPNSRGGQAGRGDVTGGGGGAGGLGWYNVASPRWYDSGKANWRAVNPDPARFTHFLNSDEVHGRSGEGVGGRRSRGRPVKDPGRIDEDWSFGAGIGSWAWPPVADGIFEDPLNFANPRLIESHRLPGAGGYDSHSIHRSRGGGGGGYWTMGEAGHHFVAGAHNAKGEPLEPNYVPIVNLAKGVAEFNDFYDFDQLAGGGVPDAAGGDYRQGPAGFHTLDPTQGFLLGGSGGGGGGSNQHGSWNDAPSNTRGTIDTYRASSGAGGGAGAGALQLHSGGRVQVTGTVDLRGGDGGNARNMLGLPNPLTVEIGAPGTAGGGGGSGGALLVQSSGELQATPGVFRVEGGRGGLGEVGNHGGHGGSGLVRFETATGTESLSELQNLVEPTEAVDLAPIGQAGSPNRARHQASIRDQTPIEGVFSANSSGVRSLWYEPAAEIVFLQFTGIEIEAEYSLDGVTIETARYTISDTGLAGPIPGIDPIWIALQTAWGPPVPGQPTIPDAESLSRWIVPGFGNLSQGVDVLSKLNGKVARMLRFQLVFDQDRVRQLIGAHPNAFFRIKRFEVSWNGE